MPQKNKSLLKPKKALLDSSAIIALLNKEPGYKIVEDVIATSSISSVNFCEVISVLVRNKIADSDIDEIINDLIPEIIPFSKDISILSGKLIAATNSYGLSLGDRACIATGITYNLEILTTDKIWLECSIPKADIILIR